MYFLKALVGIARTSCTIKIFYANCNRSTHDCLAVKVKLWTTFNEPNMYCQYFPAIYLAAGIYTAEDMDQYECLRNIILAHAEAYHVFKEDGHDGTAHHPPYHR